MTKPLPIYVVRPSAPAEGEATGAWQVERWTDHPALIPLRLEVYTVSTDAGDVKLHLPFHASRDRAVLQWAFTEVKRLHPKPTDLETLPSLTRDALLTQAVSMALEYIQLAEDGRGHNDRSHYLAGCLRRIEALIQSNDVCPTAALIESDAVFNEETNHDQA